MLLNQKNPHGGDIYSRSVRLDFSANINPAGMPEPVRRAIAEAAGDCAVYPDPYCTALREKIAETEGVSADRVLCGNGSAELIYAFAYALPKDRPALILSPTFCEYERAVLAAGGHTEHYLLRREDGFRLTERVLRTDLARYSAVFLCSPNNPTGLTADAGTVEALADAAEKAGTRLFCDFCFLDLTSDPGKFDIPALVRDHGSLVVLRAFTKSYAMAGIRLGYALSSDGTFLGEMAEKTQCWNVSTPAQRAGIAALGCGEWLRESVKTVASERERLKKAFREQGIEAVPGEANFLLLYAEKDLPRLLAERGIAVRDCADYRGLGKGWFRIAVRRKEENDALIAAVGEVLS